MPIDLTIILIIIFRTLNTGANLNNFNVKHKNLILNLKEDLMLMKTLIKSDIKGFELTNKVNN